MAGASKPRTRGTEKDNLSRQVVFLHGCSNGQSYCDTGYSDEIMTTCVTNAFQGIHLRMYSAS